MKDYTHTVLVTAVGALIGQGIIRSLRAGAPRHRILGLDRSSNRYAASIADKCFQKPCKEDDLRYLPWLRKIIESEGIELILPGIEDDVFFLHDQREAMRDWPVKVALNSIDAIVAGLDKWLLHERMVKGGLPTIPTMLVGDWVEFGAQLGVPPYIVKAKRGSGSRGQMILHSEDHWVKHRNQFDDRHMVQRYVGSDDNEYTVDVFGLGDGTATGFFVMKRRLGSGGTWSAEVVEGDEALVGRCASLNQLLKPVGPTNYQFRREGGEWFFLEINPRISASTSIRAGFGFNESVMSVDYYLGGRVPDVGPLRRGHCQRYVADYFDYA